MDKTNELARERESVARVQQLLYAVIQQSKGFSEYHDGTIRMLLADAWEELRLKPTALSPQDLETLASEIKRFELRKAFSHEMMERYERMLLAPFFARVDFVERGQSGPDRIVIGMYSLKDEKGNLLVHDWRAPICALYYDAVPGEVSYQAPEGEILGTMTLKRQYRMQDGKLQYYVDTDVCIEDDLLLDILSGATSRHMRTIVSTIQKEQNQAIRHERAAVLSVIGGAGSGKTSIAMHRAAYLMYRQRALLDANSIAILSPSSAFSEYIGNVLPDLGEENTKMPVLAKVYETAIGLAPEPPLKQVERLSQKSYTLRRDSVQYKSGADFCQLLEAFVRGYKYSGPAFEDIGACGKTLLRKGDLERMYRSEFRMLSPSLRLIRIQAVLDSRLEAWERSLRGQYEPQMAKKYRGKELEMAARMAVSQRLQPVRQQIRRLMQVDPLMLYADALKDVPEALYTAAQENAAARLVWWEDAPGIAYLMLKLGFTTPDRTIRQLLVDEAQDYSNIALSFLHLYYPMAQITLLGDPNQRTCPGMPMAHPESWGACFGAINSPIVRLTRCYRSTAQITRLCNAILPEGLHVQEFGREGVPPSVGTYDPETLKQIVSGWQQAGITHIAIITRALPEAERLAALFDRPWLLRDTDDMMPDAGGVVISCYHLMKGLEFDAVAVVWPEAELSDGERRRLYTACSRALHNLALLGDKKLIDELGIVL